MFQHPKRSVGHGHDARRFLWQLLPRLQDQSTELLHCESRTALGGSAFFRWSTSCINDVQNIWLQNDRLCAEIRETLDCQKRGWNSKLISVCWSLPESDAAAFAYTLQGGVGAAQMELSEESKIPRTFFGGGDSRFWHGLTVKFNMF